VANRPIITYRRMPCRASLTASVGPQFGAGVGCKRIWSDLRDKMKAIIPVLGTSWLELPRPTDEKRPTSGQGHIYRMKTPWTDTRQACSVKQSQKSSERSPVGDLALILSISHRMFGTEIRKHPTRPSQQTEVSRRARLRKLLLRGYT
jgi:hypothetical protein